MHRRTFLGIAVTATLMATNAVTAAPIVVDVYKKPTCGCCGKWIEHMRANGFTVTVNEVPNVDAFRTKAGVPPALSSCHTALVDGYVVEGHVPAADVRKLINERPMAAGLAVPGMPAGSPGMEAPRGDAYDVLLFQRDGRTSVYRAYQAT